MRIKCPKCCKFSEGYNDGAYSPDYDFECPYCGHREIILKEKAIHET
jgi:predicted RNA-binding Zn-ribbon protein involved in translation (DUF1610 family)